MMEQTFDAIFCSHCNVRMTEHRPAGSKIQYYRCGTCHRSLSSSYAEVLHAQSSSRAPDPAADARRAQQFDAVKGRLERWLAGLEEKDPYRVLGVSPNASVDEVRSRYREAALEHHPDRGGSAQRMAELNRAFERITQHQDRKPRTALPANGTSIPDWRPRQVVEVRASRPRYSVPAAVLDRA